MTDIAIQRVKREFREVIKSDEVMRNTINLELVADSFRELKGEITGPPDTPYEGGRFKLLISVPETYPFTPPKVKFLTKLWHPNVSSVTGAICLDILKDQWAAAMTLRTVLISLQALLAAAEPDDPQDAVVARQYRDNHSLFIKTAQHWSYFYAGAPQSKCIDEFMTKMQHLKDMGVTESQALHALSTCNWDKSLAIEQLFS